MRARKIRGGGLALAGLLALAPTGGAAQAPEHLWIPGADPERGRALVQRYECGVCHTIERVRGARGIVGPKIERFAERTMLAGVMANVPRNLVAWLMDPPAFDPDTAMPNLGLSEAQARDIAAFLYTLGARAAAETYRPEVDVPTGGHAAAEGLTQSQTRRLGGAGDGIAIGRAMEMLSSHAQDTPVPSEGVE